MAPNFTPRAWVWGDDCVMLTELRQKRMAELSTINTKSVYNQVYPLQKPDWSKDVTEESKKAFVFVLLTSSQGMNVESRLLVEFWRELARVYGDVKFGQIRGELCIEGYPDKNTPTILVYKNGDIKKQIVTLLGLKGTQTKLPGRTPDLSFLPYRSTRTDVSRSAQTLNSFLLRWARSPKAIHGFVDKGTKMNSNRETYEVQRAIRMQPLTTTIATGIEGSSLCLFSNYQDSSCCCTSSSSVAEKESDARERIPARAGSSVDRRELRYCTSRIAASRMIESIISTDAVREMLSCTLSNACLEVFRRVVVKK
jgi:hypothetical protein